MYTMCNCCCNQISDKTGSGCYNRIATNENQTRSMSVEIYFYIVSKTKKKITQPCFKGNMSPLQIHVIIIANIPHMTV